MSAPKSVREIRDSVQSGTLDPVDLANSTLEAMEVEGRALGAVVSIDKTQAIRQAEDVRKRVCAGQVLPLAGVPVAVKDNICVSGQRTTCGSRMLEDYVSPFHATAVERLLAAGAVVVGKTNMDEFGMGSSTERSAFYPCKNPWDPKRTPGGSSGGSAAVVAAGIVPVALGSDTGGSIRQPAALTGTFGLKPTYGHVSRFGLVAFGSSLEQIGPIGKSADDAALVDTVISGFDPKDATSAHSIPGSRDEMRGLRGLRVGVLRDASDSSVDSPIREAIARTVARLEQGGANVIDVTLPTSKYAIATYYILANCEASSNLARHSGVHHGRRSNEVQDLNGLYSRSRGEGFGDEVKRRILLGTFCLSAASYDAFYDRAMRVRTLIQRDFDAAFRDVDILLSPTTPTLPFRLGEKLSDPIQMYLADVFTVAGSLAGIPGLSFPAGTAVVQGSILPIGLQLQGPPFSEGRLLSAASLLAEPATPGRTKSARSGGEA